VSEKPGDLRDEIERLTAALSDAQKEADYFRNRWPDFSEALSRADAAEARAQKAEAVIATVRLHGSTSAEFLTALTAYDEPPTEHRGSCRVFYAEGVCTCGAEPPTEQA